MEINRAYYGPAKAKTSMGNYTTKPNKILKVSKGDKGAS